ncbi:DUF1127 domain-containing protein [Roseomonas sp. BU-1]|uniref:DUF1127 domain-containing protein n=2 Tax=Falsiroseomonas selenitidurans TaxID=2716335 RepID=A0ABX1E713_9PROT|nr:DUF1127 domain-containing protein [Falsiroseomonas selenitidurans]
MPRSGGDDMRWLRGLFRLLRAWAERSAQRRLLDQLSEAELKDMGITRYDAAWEARKPFWRN